MNRNKYINNKGLAPILILVVIIIGLIVGVVLYNMFYSVSDPVELMSGQNYKEEVSNPPAADEPVSEDDDFETIEAELDATVTGSPSEDFSEIETEASQL